MDYEKKYKEALERAKEKYTKCYSPTLLDYIFPELKSEDVEIRRSIIRNLKRYIKCIKDGYDASSAKDFVVKEIDKQIAWLEKQGDKDSQVKLPTFTFDDILALQCCMETVKKVQNDKDLYEKLNDLHGRIYDAYYLEKQGNTNETINKDEFAQGVLKGAAINLITWIDYNAAEGNMCLSNMECKDVEDALVSGDWNKIYAYIKKKLEKQGEQKETLCDKCKKAQPSHSCQDITALGRCYIEAINTSTSNKVKPKFKVGDWIISTLPGIKYPHLITDIRDGYYIFGEDDDHAHIASNDDVLKLWTIQDAKDGDVLVSRSPFIYGKQCPYGGLNWCNNKFIKASNFIFTDNPVHPATKEQRDFLFQKMKEAGYTFDFEKKELKKIKNDIEIPFGAKDSELQEATYFIPKGFHAEIDNDKVVIKKGEKPTAWSKKDEKMFKYALNMIEWYSGKNEDKSRFVSDWLKSIKDRVGYEVNCATTKEWSEEDERNMQNISLNLV